MSDTKIEPLDEYSKGYIQGMKAERAVWIKVLDRTISDFCEEDDGELKIINELEYCKVKALKEEQGK